MARTEFSLRIVRSDGQEFLLGDGSFWVLSMNDMSDWIALDYSIETFDNVLTDGSTLVSKRVNERDRTLRAVYWGRDRTGARAQAIAFFNPKYTYEAHIMYMGRKRWVEGEQYAFDCPISDDRTPTQITWTLLCLDPYFRSESHNEQAFGDSEPRFGFPYVSIAREKPEGGLHIQGAPASVLLYDGLNTVYNDGDVPTYYQVVIEADGNIQNPTINKDGRFVKVVDTLNAGDRLVIDFESSPPKVEKNGVNCIQSCSRDSNFTGMKMQTGGNVFSFTLDNVENKPLARVQVLFYRKYLGV